MFVRPTHCPSCGSELEYDSVTLYCVNDSCPAQVQGIVTHFFKTMEIKGVGPVTASKLDADVLAILSMSEEQICSVVGKANGSKLFAAINQALTTSHDGAQVIAAMGIPSVGANTSSKLANCIVDGQLQISEESLVGAGITPATRQKIQSWFETVFQEVWKGKLPLPVSKPSDKAIRLVIGPTVCITGKIDGHTRTSLATYLSDKYGCKVVSTVSKNLDYLICNQTSSSSSYIKAQSLGIPILTLDQLEKKLND